MTPIQPQAAGAKRYIESALRRRVGSSTEEREAVAAQLAKFDDWYTTCRVCGKQRTGTIAQLKEPCAHEKG